MRMARVNITVPDDLLDQARGVGERGAGRRTTDDARGRDPDRMTLVFDAGGLSALPAQHARLQELRRRGLWPALVLTSDPRDLRALAENAALPISVVGV